MKVMKTIVCVLALSSVGQAATTAIFMIQGKNVSPQEALQASTKGQEVYRCQLVRAHLSKSGTTISLRAVSNRRAKGQLKGEEAE